MKKNSLLKLIIILMIPIICIFIFLLFFTNEEEQTENNIQYSPIDTNNIKKEKYECNEFSYVTVTTDNLLSMYLNDYKYNMLNDIETAYNSLNKEYREAKFGNIEKYKEYIDDNIKNIKQIKLNKYLINNYDNFNQYICMDQYNNYYVFESTAVMKYTVKLDTYRILNDEEIKEYNQLTTVRRSGYNIERCIEAINNKDYAYVYSKLDETFKNNNYPTIESFENNIKENLFENNEIDTTNRSTREGDIYIYKFTLKDVDNENNKKDMSIIMKLKEGTDFVMSYAFE